MNVWSLLVVVFGVMGLGGLAWASVGPGAGEANPLLEEWTTPFGLPPFDRIEERHFPPALEAGIAAQRAEITAIADSPEAPTFANTLEALDRAGDLLLRVRMVFGNLFGTDTTEGLQAIARDFSPKLSALSDDVIQNPKLYARVKALYDQRAQLKLAPEELRLLEETHKGFVRGGAGLAPEKQARLREINAQLSMLGLQYGDNLLKETNGFRLVLDQTQLAGLTEQQLAGAAEDARAAGLEGKWLFTVQWPSYFPFLGNSQVRELREQLQRAYATRGAQGNAANNQANLAQQAALRVEKAQLLGYQTWAQFVLEDSMARTPGAVTDLLDRLWKPALARAVSESERLQEALDEEAPGEHLAPWDWFHYAEQIRRTEYGLDDAELRPYFELNNVVQGAFEVAKRLYGLTFKELKGVPVYHPEVRVYEVLDRDGSHLGLFLTDYHPRASKRGGAWCGGFRDQFVRDGKDVRPIVTNVGNFTKPSAGKPALLSLEETETLFHEFGHGLHSLVSRVHYASLGGVPRDFVELPSQIMENWALEPQVLALYARHYQTGKPIPTALVDKVRKARLFNQGFLTVEYLAASFLDLAWHTLEDTGLRQADVFEAEAMNSIGLIPQIIPRYRSGYFNHIFGGGGAYSAGYYSYIWSEVLDADAYAAFEERGLFDQATATAFRREILEPAGTREASAMYRAFRGRDPQVAPLLKRRGLD